MFVVIEGWNGLFSANKIKNSESQLRYGQHYSSAIHQQSKAMKRRHQVFWIYSFFISLWKKVLEHRAHAHWYVYLNLTLPSLSKVIEGWVVFSNKNLKHSESQLHYIRAKPTSAKQSSEMKSTIIWIHIIWFPSLRHFKRWTFLV